MIVGRKVIYYTCDDVYIKESKQRDGKIMKNHFVTDPFPERTEDTEKKHRWIYGRAEREVFRQQQLIRAKNEARLKVGYPGEFMLPHATIRFRATLPAGVFPVRSIGVPEITEICMSEPGVFEFTLSVADTEKDVPCFCCDAPADWESSFDGETWCYTTAVSGGKVPPHREELPVFKLIPEKLPGGMYDAGREIYHVRYRRLIGKGIRSSYRKRIFHSHR